MVRIKDLKDRDELRNTIYNYGIELDSHNPNHYLSFLSQTAQDYLLQKEFIKIISLPIHPDATKQDETCCIYIKLLVTKFLKK